MLKLAAAVPLPWRQRLADLRGRGVYQGYPNRCGCIFIHIPRTAGSSVANILFAEPSRHLRYAEYLRANPDKFARFFKFAFVRNPWDRLVSAYWFLRQGGVNQQDRAWSARHLQPYPDFAAFVRGWISETNIRSWVHFVPQSDFILDDAGRLMVDFLGRYERLDRDFAMVAHRLGRNVKLPALNASRHGHPATCYDEDTQDIVRRVYARDIEAFEYRFGDFDGR